MKILDKLGLALFSIIVLILSIILCLISFGWVDISVISIALTNLINEVPNGVYIAVYSSVIFIVLSIKCLFFPSYVKNKQEDDDGILMQNDNGKLLITKDTLENIVNNVIEDTNEIQSAETEVEINKDNEVHVNLSINVYTNSIIKDVSAKLQDNIKESVKKATDLEVQSINIRISDVEREENNEEKNNENVQ